MRISLFVFLAASLLAVPAMASEPSSTELAIARRLFQEASELELDGQWALAAVRLKESIQIKETPGLRFHLGHCEEKLGLWVEAMLDYDRARDLITAGASAKDVEALLDGARRSLAARIPTLVILAPANGPELMVELNDKPQAQSIVGRPAPLNPGSYRVVVRAPGHSPLEAKVVLAEGDRKSVDAKLSPLANAPRKPPAEPNAQRVAGYAVLGAGAVGAGVGTYFLVSSLNSRSDADRAYALCIDTPALCESSHGRRLDADADRSRTWAIVSYAVGGAAIATGIVLLFTDHPPSNTRQGASLEGIDVRVGLGSFTLSGRF